MKTENQSNESAVKNSKDKLSKILSNAQDFSKKTAQNVQEATKAFAKKVKIDSQQRKLKKLNPLFSDEFSSDSFHIPNIIKIVDDAERRDIEMCEGAIGWRSKENNTEILFLYDEERERCGIEFVPNFSCNSIYCVDPFDRNRFIKVDCIFAKSQEEKLAELENIAFCLGAKACSIEIVSSETTSNINKTSFSATVKGGTLSSESRNDTSVCAANKSTGKTVIKFEGHNSPTAPKLKWFTYDDTINNLIKMRCDSPNSIKSRALELSGSSSATMSVQTAIAIDALSKKAKATSNMEAQSTMELNSKLVFEIEF